MRLPLWSTVALTACLAIGSLWATSAGATHHKYPIKAVTIKVDRSTDVVYGKVIADSTVAHFCGSSFGWPVNVYRAKRGRDDKVAHLRTKAGARWTFKVPNTLAGKRLYAEMPSYPNSGHGYCIGDRSRTVRAP